MNTELGPYVAKVGILVDGKWLYASESAFLLLLSKAPADGKLRTVKREVPKAENHPGVMRLMATWNLDIAKSLTASDLEYLRAKLGQEVWEKVRARLEAEAESTVLRVV